MTRLKKCFMFFIMLLMTCVIIFAGYRALAVAGNYFIISDNTIKTYPLENVDSYVFYSQTDSELTLYPWNYYDSAEPLSSLELLYPDKALTDFMLVNSDYLYNTIRYYFYKTVPLSVKEEILTSGSSLYEIMDFQNIIGKLKAKTLGTTDYYFYDETINILGINYRLSFSFGNYLYSFQCRQELDADMYSRDNMQLGNEYLSNFIHYNEQENLNLLLLDIFTSENYLENYALTYIDADNISFNLSDERIEDSELYSKNNSSIPYTDDNTEKISYSSYQIVETKDELLLILADNNIVLHFDPINRMFTGFNLMG